MSDKTLGEIACEAYSNEVSKAEPGHKAWEAAAQAVADEYMKRLRELSKKLEPELDCLVDRDPIDRTCWEDDAVSLACKLYDAIMDPEEAKP